jgi:hypothetical protein
MIYYIIQDIPLYVHRSYTISYVVYHFISCMIYSPPQPLVLVQKLQIHPLPVATADNPQERKDQGCS